MFIYLVYNIISVYYVLLVRLNRVVCGSDFMKVARRLTIIEGTEGRPQKPLVEYMVERA